MRRIFLSVFAMAVLSAVGYAEEALPLVDQSKPGGGWEFGDGPEFPGAEGKLERKAEKFQDRPVLGLNGDFSKGGNYVQAAISLPETPIDTLSFWINAPKGAGSVPVRLVDGSGQCHQLRIKVNDKGGWQKVTLPIDEFFGKMGTAGALDVVAQYEKWGGANDGRWHQPGKLLVILFSRSVATEGEILFSDVLLHPARPTTAIAKTISLDEMLQLGEIDWGFNLGWEFPGAKGGLELVADQPQPGKNAMRLHADFTGGGSYVGMRKSFAQLDVQAMNVIRMKMRSETTKKFNLRLVDGTGQCHQRKGIPFTADGRWHEVDIVPTKIAGGEHWGGANDGQWHDSVRLVELMLNTDSSDKKASDLYISDIRADVVIEATATPATFSEDFDTGDPLKQRWHTSGDVAIAEASSGSTGKSLVLRRTVDALQTKTAATCEPFAVRPGTWQVQYAWKADLRSPDNSYHGAVALDVFDRSGKLLETLPVGIGFGRRDWQAVSEPLVLPVGAAKARLTIELKKTYGAFHVDQFSASRLKVQPIERRVERILLAGSATGHLFLPGQDVDFRVTVETVKPLAPDQQTFRYGVSDYWGALELPPAEATLSRQPSKKGRWFYTAEVALAANELQVGRYYELHVEVPQPPGEPATEYSGLAVLPPAAARQHAPEAVPFTIRNWDSRVPVYFDLADRIGLRMIGVWGGWSAKPPYKPHCPGIERCEKLGAKWVTGTPASHIEREGFDQYDEKSLREGMKNFLEAYADRGLAMIAIGNEPHGKGDKVLQNVRAYRAIYETVKAFDPKIHVIGTSVEPNEEYFKAGYQNYLDSYDFHIYEHYTNVRRTMRQYRELMEKYDAVKPIHSTELGLNSQGQTRLAVSRELIKKFVSFFAEGGATVSWFTIQYPDPKGKARGQFGDSHCVFDCKYNLYNPRLDAVAHYHILNAICVKKFAEEQHYAGGAQAYLFRDQQGRCLQVLWSDGRRQDVFVPLPAGRLVTLVGIDGTGANLQTGTGGLTLSLGDDPLLLLYEDKDPKLAESLGESLGELLVEATVALVAEPSAVRPGKAVDFTLAGPGANVSSLEIDCPPLWKASTRQAGDGRVVVTIDAPASTPARQAQVRVRVISKGTAVGMLSVPITVDRESR